MMSCVRSPRELARSRLARTALGSAGLGLLLVLGAGRASAQESLALFDAPHVVAENPSRRIQLLCDVNGDGQLDLAGAFWETTAGIRIRTWTNDGQGGFTEGLLFTISEGSWLDAPDLAAGDFDGDGRDDFVLGAGTKVTLILNTAGGAVVQDQISFSDTVRFVCVCDADGDGDLDIGAADFSSFSVLRNEGLGLPFTRIGVHHGLPGVTMLADANLDPQPGREFLLGAYPATAAFELSGGQLVQIFTTSPALTLTAQMPAAGDVDQDGDEDVVVFGFDFGTWKYAILRNNGFGQFVLESPLVGGPATRLADVDGDGDLDGICCGGGGGGPSSFFNNIPSDFEVAIFDQGVFQPAFKLPGLGSLRIAGAADLDHDGDVELVAGRCILWGRGPLSAAHFPTAGFGLTSPAAAFDLDQDGDPDLQASPFGYARNAGDGSFSGGTPWVQAAPSGMHFVGPGFIGDVTGDGAPDFVVEMRDAQGAFVSERLLMNNGGAGFMDMGDVLPAGQSFTLPPTPDNGRAVDVDGDGDVDLMVLRTGVPRGTDFYLNQGNGTFVAGPTLNGHIVKFVGNLNGDATPDVITTGQGLVVLYGLGGATFGGGFTLTNAYHATEDRFGAEDFDSDGDVDIIAGGVAIPNVNNLALFRNDGGGNFTAESATNFGVTNGFPYRMVTADVNGDGRADLLVNTPMGSTSEAGSQRIWRALIQNAPGSATVFTAAAPMILDVQIAGDVDGDGDDDVLGARVLRSCAFDGPEDGLRLQYGNAAAGAQGMKPTLGASGPFRPGEAATLRIRGGASGAPALFVAGVTQTSLANLPLPGMSTYVFPWQLFLVLPLGSNAGMTGEGALTIPYVVPAAAAGFTFYHQAFIADANAPGGASATNGLRLGYGF